MELYLNQVPVTPLSITISYFNGKAVNLSAYTSFTLKIVDPYKVQALSFTGNPATYAANNVLTLPWLTIGATSSTFSKQGDYRVQVTLNGTPPTTDVTSTEVINVYKKVI